MQEFFNYLTRQVEDGQSLVIKLFFTFVFIGLIILINKVISRIIEKTAKSEKSVRDFQKVARPVSLILIIGGVVYLWFASLEGLGVLLISIILVTIIVLRDLLLDIICYFYVLFRKPFAFEDTIELAGHIGIVEDMDFMQIYIQELSGLIDTNNPTGRVITIPNSTLMNSPMINYTRDSIFLVQEISLLVDFDTDHDKAVDLANQ